MKKSCYAAEYTEANKNAKSEDNIPVSKQTAMGSIAITLPSTGMVRKRINMKLNIKDVLHWVIQILGTFLFVFFLMAATVVAISGVNMKQSLLPYFNLPAYFVCVTIGAKYWVGNDGVRRWSYCVSTILFGILTILMGGYRMPSYVNMPEFKVVFASFLTLCIILYSILYVRKRNAVDQPNITNERTIQERREKKSCKQASRIICLLSICCVLLGSFQCAVLSIYSLITNVNLSIEFSTLSPLPLSILSAILLARFMKVEFVQWKPSLD